MPRSYPTQTPHMQVRFYFEHKSGVIESCVLWYEVEGVQVDASYTDLLGTCNLFYADVAPAFANMMDEQNKVKFCEMIWRPAENTQLIAFSDAAAIDGTVTSDTPDLNVLDAERQTEPTYVAAVIRRLTGNNTRAGRGRLFVPNISNMLISSAGELNDEGQTASKDLAAKLGADIVVGDESQFTFHARHYDRKNDTLRVVTHCLGMVRLSTRRDRKKQGPNLPVSQTGGGDD